MFELALSPLKCAQGLHSEVEVSVRQISLTSKCLRAARSGGEGLHLGSSLAPSTVCTQKHRRAMAAIAQVRGRARV